MKNVIKKSASIAMAFTLLGTGTVVTKTISPKSDNILIAYAGISNEIQPYKFKSLYQDDYDPIDGISISRSGCGPTSLMMVLGVYGVKKLNTNSLFDPRGLMHEMYVNNEYKKNNGTSREGITKRAAEYGVGVKWSNNINDVLNAIQGRNVVIINVWGQGNSKSHLCPKGSNGHYIVVSGHRYNNGVEEYLVDNPKRGCETGWVPKSHIETDIKGVYSYGICFPLKKMSSGLIYVGGTAGTVTKKGKAYHPTGLLYSKNIMTEYEVKFTYSINGRNEYIPLKKSKYKCESGATHAISFLEDLDNNLPFSKCEIGRYCVEVIGKNNGKVVISDKFYVNITS